MWYGVVEEDREKRLASTPFTNVYGELIDQPSPNPLSLAEVALKVRSFLSSQSQLFSRWM